MRPRTLVFALTLAAGPAVAQERLVPFGPHPANGNQRSGLDLRLGGQYRVLFNTNNFGFHPAALTRNQEAESFFNQRFRTWLTVKTSPRVQAYLQVEMGHIVWGEDFEFPKAFAGPRFPAAADPAGDRVGVEVRRAFLTYDHETLGRFRVGIQDWQDPFGQTLASSDWDFNVGGISYRGTCSALADLLVRAGAFTLWEGSPRNADDAYLFTLDLDLEREEQRLGLSVYFLRDQGVYSYPTLKAYEDAWDLWVGLRGHLAVGSVPVTAFLLLNTGGRDDGPGLPAVRHTGVALKLEAPAVRIGPGDLGLQILFASGDDDPAARRTRSFRTIAQSARDGLGAQGYWSYLVITSPHGPSDVADLGVSLQNRGAGLWTLQSRYRYPLAGSLSGTLAAGWLRAAARNPASGKRDMGVEVANTFSLNLGSGLILDFGAAYLFTGGYFRKPGGGSPNDLFEIFSRLQLEF